jgi:hypothetical protein
MPAERFRGNRTELLEIIPYVGEAGMFLPLPRSPFSPPSDITGVSPSTGSPSDYAAKDTSVKDVIAVARKGDSGKWL